MYIKQKIHVHKTKYYESPRILTSEVFVKVKRRNMPDVILIYFLPTLS